MTIKEFKILKWENDCSKTKMPKEYVPVYNYSDKTANSLTRLVCDFIKLMGGQAERISNSGRYLDNSRIVTDVIGIQRKIGSGKFIPGTGRNGTADISATIKGKSVKIEVKIGKDRQSESQKEYQAEVEQAGGVYMIAKDWVGFYSQYTTLISSI